MEGAAKQLESGNRVQRALEAGELYVAFQPIIDLKSWRTFGYEALLRSRCPDYPGPLQVLSAAVQQGFLGKLGRALRQMSIDGCPAKALFLNIHPDEFDEKWLVQPNDPLLWHEGDVYLEITESVPLSHYQFCHSVLKEIRAKGVKLAVDDLGAGYSNLLYIADLQPDVVKIDRELIMGIDKDNRRFKLVKSIVELCRAQGARVVAEGIETRGELLKVIAAGAHYGQGYYIARPNAVPPEANWRALVE